MRKYLPTIFVSILTAFFLLQTIYTSGVFAQADPRSPRDNPPRVDNTTPRPGVPTGVERDPNPNRQGGRETPNPEGGAQPIQPNNPTIPEDTWVQDKEVTFTGKNAARAGILLNWVLRDYKWSHVKNNKNPLENFWAKIRDIVYGLLILFVIVTAFILITTRGRSIKAMRFIPRFIAVVLLVTFSFALIQLLYEATDLIQGFFLANKKNGFCPPDCISQRDLLFVGWDYRPFFGIRRFGEQFEESAFVSLLLVKLTALTYYVMVGVLIIRKIILWFFIIVSPIFPLLLLYYPVRNTGKIWIGEFFRWLMYAPLFAIFLGGLVSLWGSSIPMNFDFKDVHKVDKIVFQTSINILIGGPKQLVNLTNSVNTQDTFALYIVALLMLWGVIIVPWILLQIFLDFAMSYNYGENPMVRQLLNFMGKPPPSPTPPPSGSTGTARPLPFKDFIVPEMPKGAARAMQIPRDTRIVQPVRVPLYVNKQQLSEVARLTSLSVPTMRDISRYETSLLSKDISKQSETTQIRQQLNNLATPMSASSAQIREQLTQQSQQGNALASSILTAASSVKGITTSIQQMTTQQITTVLQQISRPETVSNPIERQKIIQMKDTIIKESKVGNPLAVTIINATRTEKPTEVDAKLVGEKLKEAKAKGDPLAKAIAGTGPASPLPNVNRIQQVSLDDYEAVKKMWSENYQKLDVPVSMTGSHDRKAWVKDDIRQISDTINLLSSTDPKQVEEGMQEVSNILPFLLMGGFSQAEIIAYLKAKQEAGKSVLEDLEKTSTEEDTMVDLEKRKTENVGHMTMEAAAPLEENEIVAESERLSAQKQEPNGNGAAVPASGQTREEKKE